MNEIDRRNNERAGSRELRKALLGLVYDLVSENGIEGTGMRLIAEAGNVSTGTINYHFGNKQALLLDAYDAAYQLPEDWESYSGSALNQLKRLVSGYVFRNRADRFWRFWINYTAWSTRDEVMRDRQQERYTRQESFWGQLLRDGIEQGVVRQDVDCKIAAEKLLVLAHGLVIRQILSPSTSTREACRAMIDEELAGLSASR